MKAIVKSIDTGSHVAFDKYRPDDETCFGLWLTVLVGPDDEEGGHLYRILVCTADWIKRECLHSGAVWGRHMLIVLCYDRDRIESEIAQYVDGCTGKDFWELAQKVARIGAWEFEDYQGC
ncbi:immunity 8 family protein [Ralstonia pseudosolanacearum]|uniref:immunity 8 family protein n=1 Tax=Ralstonia pseudosolanacearum TaxID=1310165 RepID=UPI003D05936B